MDIFTTQLAKVSPNKIEVDSLKVKAVAKEAKLHPIKDDIKEITEKQGGGQQQAKQNNKSSKDDDQDSKAKKDDESLLDKDGHLDIYV